MLILQAGLQVLNVDIFEIQVHRRVAPDRESLMFVSRSPRFPKIGRRKYSVKYSKQNKFS